MKQHDARQRAEATPQRDRARDTAQQPGDAAQRPGDAAQQQGLLQLQALAGNRAVNAKLEIGDPDSPQEREADAVARRVVGNAQAEGGVDGVRAAVEDELGADLSSARIHVDDQADQMSRSINAKAFTAGSDVYFKAGAFDTDSSAGRELIAHEFTHVAQQNPAVISRAPDDGGYRKSFSSPSLGTEQELGGVWIEKPMRAGRQIATIVRGSEVLLEITTDMSVDGAENGRQRHTIELVTHPTEASDDDGWSARQRAAGLAVAAINGAAGAGGKLVGQADGDLDLVVTLGDHTVGGGSVGRSSNQATLGIATDTLGTGAGEAALVEQASWFKKGWQPNLPDDQLDDAGLSNRMRDYVASVIGQLADLIANRGVYIEGGPEANKTALNDPTIKNSWGILPRSSPWSALSILSSNDRSIVQHSLRNESGKPAHWKSALGYIASGQSLAGHAVSGATVDSKDASLFEFRIDTNMPPELARRFFATRTDEQLEQALADAKARPRMASSVMAALTAELKDRGK